MKTNFVVTKRDDPFRALTIEQIAYWKVLPDQPKQIDWCLDILNQLGNLLTLLMGTPARFHFLTAKPTGTNDTLNLLYSRVGDPESDRLLAAQMLFSFPDLKDSFAQILDCWFAAERTLRDARRLLFGTLYFRPAFLEPWFLSLSQAIETYSRSRGADLYVAEEKYDDFYGAMANAIPNEVPSDLRASLKSRLKYGNEFTLRKRLALLLESLDEPTRGLICRSPTDFKNGVIDTQGHGDIGKSGDRISRIQRRQDSR